MGGKILKANDANRKEPANPVITEILNEVNRLKKILAMQESANNLHANLLLVLIRMISDKFNMDRDKFAYCYYEYTEHELPSEILDAIFNENNGDV